MASIRGHESEFHQESIQADGHIVSKWIRFSPTTFADRRGWGNEWIITGNHDMRSDVVF
jgi:hypothetical protein